jgi:hypothetical protein
VNRPPVADPRPIRILAALLLASAAVASQAQRPNLNGTWAYQPGQSGLNLPAAPTAIGMLGSRFSITVDDARATLTSVASGASITSSMPLDGSRATSRQPGRLCEGERLVSRTARWDGTALVITSVGATPAGGGPTTEMNLPFILRLDGERLVVVVTIAQQGGPQQVGAVYARSTDPLPPPRAPDPVAGISATIGQLSWIAGTWQSAPSASGLVTEEIWSTPASGGMIAMARATRATAAGGTSLGSFEFLCIAERNGTVAYLAMPNARFPATLFILTSVTSNSATFENPSHDFPKMIRYRLTDDGGLETAVAGANGERMQTVVLRKKP